MNQRPTVRGIAAYLALVAGGSVAVALAFSRGAAAPPLFAIVPVAVLLTLTLILGRSTWSSLGLARCGVRRWPVALAVPASLAASVYGIGVLTGVVVVVPAAQVGWLPQTEATSTNARTEPAPVLALSGSSR